MAQQNKKQKKEWPVPNRLATSTDNAIRDSIVSVSFVVIRAAK